MKDGEKPLKDLPPIEFIQATLALSLAAVEQLPKEDQGKAHAAIIKVLEDAGVATRSAQRKAVGGTLDSYVKSLAEAGDLDDGEWANGYRTACRMIRKELATRSAGMRGAKED
jgi:hypothetical protein